MPGGTSDKLARYRGKWCLVEYDEGTRRRTSLGIDSDRPKSDAQAELARLRRARRELSRPANITVEFIWQRYVAEKVKPAAKSRATYAWKRLRPHFAHLSPDDITLTVCRAYTAAERAANISDGTIHTDLGYLATALNYGHRLGMSAHPPSIERPPKPRPRDRHLTREDAVKLINNCAMPHVRLFCILAVATAGRMSAILDLTWDRVDFDSGHIYLDDPARERTAKGRANVPMNDMARHALLEARRGAISEHVIEWGGERVASVKKGISAAARRAGLDGVTAHVLRHTAAVWMAVDGIAMRQISDYLGHSNTAVTERTYARFRPDHLRGAAASLDLHTALWINSGSPPERGANIVRKMTRKRKAHS